MAGEACSYSLFYCQPTLFRKLEQIFGFVVGIYINMEIYIGTSRFEEARVVVREVSAGFEGVGLCASVSV